MTFSECKSDYMAPLPWLKTLQWLPTALWIKAVSARWRRREGLAWSGASASSRPPHHPLAVPVAPPGAPQASALPPSPPGSVPSLRNALPRSVTKLTHPRHRTHAHSLLKEPSPAFPLCHTWRGCDFASVCLGPDSCHLPCQRVSSAGSGVATTSSDHCTPAWPSRGARDAAGDSPL